MTAPTSLPRRARGAMSVGTAIGIVLAIISAVVLVLDRAAAQQVPNPTAEQIQQLQEQRRTQAAGTGQEVTPQTTILEPTAPVNPRLPTSELEQIMSSRAGQDLRQYGYDQFGEGRAVSLPQVGAVQDNYVLGVGDEVILTLRGQENSEYRAVVDRDGNVTFPRLNPLSAAGRSFGQFRQSLLDAVHRSYLSTEGFVTIGRLRQISVLVSGEVGSPGVRTLTGLSTVIDAIFVSGGIKKSGSLRNVRVLRDGRELTVDLYSVLNSRVRSTNVTLADGDRIVVPPIGSTVAVAGELRRPGIYELPPNRSGISVREVVSLAGGTTVPGAYTVSFLRMMADGKRQFVDVTNAPETLVRGGEVVVVRSSVNISVNQVTLTGAVRTPGTFALGRYRTLRAVLSSVDMLRPGAYVLFGYIDRINPRTVQHEAVPFSPLRVIEGKEDLPLASDDTIHILTPDDVQNLLASQAERSASRGGPVTAAGRFRAATPTGTETATQTLVTPGSAGTPPGCQQSTLPAQIDGQPAAGGASTAGSTQMAGGNAAQLGGPPMGESQVGGQAGVGTGAAAGNTAAAAAGSAAVAEAPGASFGRQLTDYRLSVFGAVQKPGTYLAAPGTTLAEALQVLGGLSADVDLSAFELTSSNIDNETGLSTTERKTYPATQDLLGQIVLRPFDRLEFHHVYSDRSSGSVVVEGEVRYPGTYDILRGERLSSVLARAGGLTEVAYPYGTVFLRKSVADIEEEANRKAAAGLRSQLFEMVAGPRRSGESASISGDALTALQALLNQIESEPALGRISIVADPAVLAANPDRDPILQPSDQIVIPKRPASVSVLGEVMRPGAFPVEADKSGRDYIKEAGGFTEFADTSRAIIVLPDGHARVEESSWFSFGGEEGLPPGTVIVVARDLTGLSLHQVIVDTTQIVSQLATTAAALAVLTTTVGK